MSTDQKLCLFLPRHVDVDCPSRPYSTPPTAHGRRYRSQGIKWFWLSIRWTRILHRPFSILKHLQTWSSVVTLTVFSSTLPFLSTFFLFVLLFPKSDVDIFTSLKPLRHLSVRLCCYQIQTFCADVLFADGVFIRIVRWRKTSWQ